ncbi:MAG: YkgJ family cysteine cluster protein [Patescibacteria group bacterium]|nr:YkgJ family cysteine cluster protein [Patescibacteria group bacterium]
MKIRKFDECQQCGECCKTPCDLIPENLSGLLKKFNMDLSSFFRSYLIALPVASPQFAEEILMMVPVRVSSSGDRSPKFLADNEYLNSAGQCIFLKNEKCAIHDIKPFGGKFMVCGKMTGSVDIQLDKKHYFAFWKNNQHLFEEIFPGFNDIYSKLENIYQRKNLLLKTVGKNNEYNKLHQEQNKKISKELFPLFNGQGPINGLAVLT